MHEVGREILCDGYITKHALEIGMLRNYETHLKMMTLG